MQQLQAIQSRRALEHITVSFGVWHACNTDARGLQSKILQQLAFGTDRISYACSFGDLPAQRCNVLNLLSTEPCKVAIIHGLADTAAVHATGCAARLGVANTATVTHHHA